MSEEQAVPSVAAGEVVHISVGESARTDPCDGHLSQRYQTAKLIAQPAASNRQGAPPAAAVAAVVAVVVAVVAVLCRCG